MANRYSNRAVLIVTGILISFVPFGYMLSSNIYEILIVRIFDGFAWAGFDLILFNYLIGITPSEGRPSYVANHTLISGVGSITAALAGGWLAMGFAGSTFLIFSGLQILFLLSFVLRLGTITFLFKIKDVDVKSPDFSLSFILWRMVAVEPVRGIKNFRDIILGRHDTRFAKGKYEFRT